MNYFILLNIIRMTHNSINHKKLLNKKIRQQVETDFEGSESGEEEFSVHYRSVT